MKNYFKPKFVVVCFDSDIVCTSGQQITVLEGEDIYGS